MCGVCVRVHLPCPVCGAQASNAAPCWSVRRCPDLPAGMQTLQFRRCVLVNDYVGFLLAAWLRAGGREPAWESSTSDIGVSQDWSARTTRT